MRQTGGASAPRQTGGLLNAPQIVNAITGGNVIVNGNVGDRNRNDLAQQKSQPKTDILKYINRNLVTMARSSQALYGNTSS